MKEELQKGCCGGRAMSSQDEKVKNKRRRDMCSKDRCGRAEQRSGTVAGGGEY